MVKDEAADKPKVDHSEQDRQLAIGNLVAAGLVLWVSVLCALTTLIIRVCQLAGQ
jgi:hypothetical protein